MVSAAALVIVLLQLHASDTLKENSEAGAPQPSPSRPQPPQPPGPRTNPPDRLLQPQGSLWRQDEDLLDLMVRIAQSPEEWERIHRVLSLIGSETNSYKPPKNVVKNQNQLDVSERKNVTESYSTLSHINESQYKTTSVTDTELKTVRSPTTQTPLTTATPEADQTTTKSEDTGTGWPDFEEAIFRKVKKPHPVDENDILAKHWIDDDWLDANWNNFLNRDENNHITSQLTKSFSTVTNDEDIKRENTIENNIVPRSRLSRDPKILEFHIKNVIPSLNHSVDQNATEEMIGSSSRAERPVFVYHRVTTSPQQRRGNSNGNGNAFIAVSVVRLGPPQHPASTLQTPTKDSSLQKHHRKHSHWRQSLQRQHNRSHRHHHVHH